MEEASFKPVDGSLPVSKRQQKGLGPPVYISGFNSIEALEKNYLAQSPSHSLLDPTLRREREGVLNRIAVDKPMMKNRVLGPASSIELFPPGETSVGFPWRPAPELLLLYFVSLFDVRILNIALCVSRRGMYACVRRWAICIRPRGV